jgi:hypothetical protein
MEIISNYDKSVLSRNINVVYRIYAGESRYLNLYRRYDTKDWSEKWNTLVSQERQKKREAWEREQENNTP